MSKLTHRQFLVGAENAQKVTPQGRLTQLGQIIPEAKIRPLKSPETHNKRDEKAGLERRQTFYVYVELLKPGQEKRPVCGVEKLKIVTRLYRTADTTEETQNRADRARDKALEEAVEIACNAMHRLRNERAPFTRVFVSVFESVAAAQKDRNTFSYY